MNGEPPEFNYPQLPPRAGNHGDIRIQGITSPQVTAYIYIYLNKDPGLVTEKAVSAHSGWWLRWGCLRCRAGFGGTVRAGLCARGCQNPFSGGPEGCSVRGCICISTSISS